MATEYMQAVSEEERRALAHRIADLRQAGVPWDGPGGIVARRLVSGAPQGRKLLRQFRLDAGQGGPVEIKPSYDRNEINPTTGKPMGWRDPKSARGMNQEAPVGIDRNDPKLLTRDAAWGDEITKKLPALLTELLASPVYGLTSDRPLPPMQYGVYLFADDGDVPQYVGG